MYEVLHGVMVRCDGASCHLVVYCGRQDLMRKKKLKYVLYSSTTNCVLNSQVAYDLAMYETMCGTSYLEVGGHSLYEESLQRRLNITR